MIARYNGNSYVEKKPKKPKVSQPLSTDEKPYNDAGTGYFSKGNPGRPKGSRNKYSLKKMEEAIEAEEKIAIDEGGVNVFRRFVKVAYVNPTVLIALIRTFLPAMQRTEIEGIEPIQLVIKHVAKDKGDKVD